MSKKETIVAPESAVIPSASAPVVVANVLPKGVVLPDINEDDFDSTETGEIFGGSYEHLMLEVGDTSNYLRFSRFTSLNLKNDKDENELVKVPLFQTLEGEYVTGPIGMIFRRQMTEMDIQEGDIVRIRREEDAIKKNGAGKGGKMQAYATKRYYSVKAEAGRKAHLEEEAKKDETTK